MAALVANTPTAPSTLQLGPSPVYGPYEPSAYDSLPSLRAAAGQFRDMDAINTVLGPICELFLAHQVHKQFGIGLLHKHFSIKETERLVDFRNIAAAWDMDNDSVDCQTGISTKYNGLVLPRAWRLVQGKFVPYEFEFADNMSQPEEACTLKNADQKFLADISSMLVHRGLDQILGLRALDQYNSDLTVEVTEGNMNIMIRQGVVPENELIEALWVFVEQPGKHGKCHCREFCRQGKNGRHIENNHSCG